MNNLFAKWKEGLARTSKAAFGQIATLFGATEIDDGIWDELEALLIQADIGVDTTTLVLDMLESRVDREGWTKTNQLKQGLRQELRARLDSPPPLN